MFNFQSCWKHNVRKPFGRHSLIQTLVVDDTVICNFIKTYPKRSGWEMFNYRNTRSTENFPLRNTNHRCKGMLKYRMENLILSPDLHFT